MDLEDFEVNSCEGINTRCGIFCRYLSNSAGELGDDHKNKGGNFIGISLRVSTFC